MNLLMGVGNILRHDDGAGIFIARHLRHPGWKTLDCGTAPENFTSVVRREHPDILLIIDAADMGMAPGAIRIIPAEKIQDVGFGTHQLPLTHLVRFLEGTAGVIIVIGIQPAVIDDGEGLSKEVEMSSKFLMKIIGESDFGKLKTLE